ncbi:MAG TPA: CHASE2 domain-containing protein, partial [Candidatus Acidoferrum sp.]|nr:CHASE2 domain-containing protein [Candidatus Acidoferrum sp.]
NFSGERFDFSPLSAHYVLAVAHEVGWANNGPFHNKIVLLGGFFRAGRDIHITPVGKMAGVQLMAQAVETELRGGGIRPLNEAVAIILDILAGTILVWFSYRFQLATALLLSLLAIPLFSLTSSYLAFSSLARWFNFVPVIVGVLIHELYHHAREYHHLLKSRG